MKTTTKVIILSLGVLAGTSACHPQDEAQSPTAAPLRPQTPIVWGDAPVNLRASINYRTGGQQVGQQTTPAPVVFNIPDAIYVQTGNAGDGQAQLQYRNATSVATCTYRGGSSIPHPVSDLDRMHGLRYFLESCDDGHVAAQQVASNWFSLRIVSGDAQDPTGVTSTALTLGGGCNAELPPPLAADEVVEMRDGFAWNTMPKLPETDRDGNPAIYHGLVYIESKDQLAALDRLRVYWSAQPISERYLSTLSGRCGRVGHSTDGRGVVVYALFPAQLFNVFRDFGIQAQNANIAPPFRFIIPTPPDDPQYVNSDGSIKYSALGSSGYADWLATHPVQQPSWYDPTSWPGDISDAASDAWGWTKNHVVNPVAHYGEYGFDYAVNGFDAAIDFSANLLDDGWKLAEQGMQKFVLVFEHRVYLNLKITVMNRDPLFPPNTPMTRMWGPAVDAKGTRPTIVPTGAHVQVQQWGFGFLPVMNQNQLNEDGTVSLTAIQGASGRGGDICIELDTDYASMTTDLIPSTVCDFASGRFSNFGRNYDYHSDPEANLEISEPDIYSLTQLKDSSDYYKTVIGGSSYTADVLTGWVANDLTAAINQDGGNARAMTPCLDFPGTGASALTAALAAAGASGYIVSSLLGPITTAVALIGSAIVETDLFLPDESADPDARLSRGTVTHEYGHFTMCSLLFAQDGPNGLDGLLPRIFQGDSKRSDELALMTESWADTFAMQVVGGTNYIVSKNSVTGPTGQIGFCMKSPCMDENYTGTNDYDVSAPFFDELARFESLIYDAFDRADTTQRFTDEPGNGDVWMTDLNTNLVEVSPAGYIANSDENVSLPGGAWRTWVARWLDRGAVANKANVIGGLVDTMADQGYNWCDRCELLALHDAATPASALGGSEDPSGQPAPTMAERSARWLACTQSADIKGWLGVPPAANLSMDASCSPCPLHNIANASGACQPCPSGAYAYDNQCVPCDHGVSATAEMCDIYIY